MPQIYESIITFTNVLAGAQSTVAHGLSNNGVALIPDILWPSNGVFSIVTVDATNVTVQNNSIATASCQVFCKWDHSIQRAFVTPGAANMTPAPFVPSAWGLANQTFGSSIVIGGAGFMSGTGDPNAANAGAGTALPAGATTGLYMQTAGGDAGALWVNIDGTATGWLNTRASGDSTMFGDGSTGALTVNGTTTEANATTPFYTDGAIGGAGIYNTAGRLIFFSGTLTITAGGVIQNNGTNASGATGGAATTGLNLFSGTAGANGGTGAGAAGSNANAATRCFSTAQHGLAGAGGAGSGGAGGAAGTQAAVATVTNSGRSSLVMGANGGFQIAGAPSLGFAPGVGGGAGGGDGAAANGGGGGGGGGAILIMAKRVIANGATPFLARGGNGAAGTANNCGGGGGGGGGTIVIVTRQYNGTALVAATHTPFGTAGASGGGAGVAGADGGNGFVIVETI